MSGPGRFEALLSYQGPLVHVDHSHRAPAPTAGEGDPARFNLKDWLEGTADKELPRQKEEQRRLDKKDREWKQHYVDYHKAIADANNKKVKNDKDAKEAERKERALSATAGEVRRALEIMPNKRFDVELVDDNEGPMHFSFKIGNEPMNRGYLVISVYPVNAPQEKWTENLGPGLNPHKLWSSKTELTYLFEQALERLFAEATTHGYEPRPWWDFRR